MSEIRIIKVEENVFASNEASANALRERLKKEKICMINFMSSPGSGKTTTLTKLIQILKKKYRIAMMDVDIETDLDARRIQTLTGVKAIQIHNCGLCHIDADMVTRALDQAQIDNVDLIILENIGNLVCPAEFDTGAFMNVMILSVPEGDDKPLKYPLMFQVSDVVLINKIDTLPVFDFNLEKCETRIHALNPKARILPISAKTEEGMEQVACIIEKEILKIKENENARNE